MLIVFMVVVAGPLFVWRMFLQQRRRKPDDQADQVMRACMRACVRAREGVRVCHKHAFVCVSCVAAGARAAPAKRAAAATPPHHNPNPEPCPNLLLSTFCS